MPVRLTRTGAGWHVEAMQFIAGLLACTLVVPPSAPMEQVAHATAEQPVGTAEVDADLELVLHTRGEPYAQARARLQAHTDLAVAQITARLAALPAPADEPRLWALLAELAPAAYVADLRAQLRPPPTVRAVPPRVTRPDPRMDPRWAARDRMLTRGVIATGVLFGLATIAMSVVIGVQVSAAARSPERCIDCPPTGLLLFVAVVPPAVVPLAVFGGLRRKHRRPLRAHEASLAGAGFRLRF